ncbi:MAG: hypothetical protein JW384_03006 [Nitrosomonadaceae bacterium]|nr:hypothetical protein [Nitrosomonadaceae bacterium]
MWKICKGYSAYDLGELKEIDASQLPLDPVEVAGSARLPRLLYHAQRLSILFAETALQLIMCPSTFMKMVEPRITNYDPGKARMVAEKWTDHFKTLLDENDESPPAERRTLCARVNISRVLFVSTYFAIPKDPTVCRAIVNGRRFSEICNPPPRVNLPDLAWVLKLLVGVFANACPFMSIGDIRHWFHQLSIHHEIARWFALRLSKDEFVVWKRLAMGWSWSPYIAQCIAFLIILIVLKELDEDISEYVNLVIPPPVIILRNKNGATIAVIALWYDNIGLFTTASALNDKFFNGLYRFCSQDSLGCGVVLKIWQLFGHRNLSTSNDKEKYPFPGYVGVEFAWQRNLESVQQLSWRVEQKRLERWKLASTWIQRRTTTTNFSQCTDSMYLL